MGAGGSTANSSSSLDMSRRRPFKQLQHPPEHQHQQQVSRKPPVPLKYRHHNQQQPHNRLSSELGAANKMRHSNSYFDLSQHQQFHEAMQQRPSVTNVYRGESNLKPSMLLAAAASSKTPTNYAPQQANACRRAAGVVSRIQRKWQPDGTKELKKKLSDSLPSLNNLLEMSKHQPGVGISHYNLYHSSSAHGQPQQPQRLPLAVAQEQRRSVKLNQQQPKIQLVNRNNEPPLTSRHKQVWGAPQRGQLNGGHQGGHLSPRLHHHNHHHHHQQQLQQQQMKRAISLSAIHNGRRSGSPYYGANHEIELPQSGSRLAGKCQQQVSRLRNDSLTGAHHNHSQQHLHLQQQQKQIERCHHQAQQQQQQQPVSSQMGKRFSKFKHAVVGNHLASKKYKPKQVHSPLQQGCPVLPPLPRAQSLHEIIQLRSTENGQRMRSTGTLRGGLGGPESGSRKVNLVVELLENKRKERSQASAAAMLSRSSSFDDGIHDISVDQSADESSSGQSSPQSINGAHGGDTDSVTGKLEAKNGGAKQRIYKKKGQFSAPSHKRFSGSNEERGVSPEKERQSTNAGGGGARFLKRASSHSALHQPESLDADESDDLNELARFLYQFRQRQASKSAAASDPTAAGQSVSALPNSHQTAAQKQAQQQQTSLQQQSPNSTTSSSGFASSISCTTSNSILSSASSSGHSSRRPAAPLNSSDLKKPNSGKKFITTTAATTTTNQPDLVGASGTGCTSYDHKQEALVAKSSLISGKLKLSSSLLSIVDEYNNNNNQQSIATLQSGRDDISPSAVAAAPTTGKLESILLSRGSVKGSPPVALGQSAAHNRAASDSSSSDEREQYLKLEELQRYTQLRQLSQSELALNHLISSSSLQPPTKRPLRGSNEPPGERRDGRNKKAHYRSKLFSLIRRVSSERPEVENNGLAGDYVQKHTGSSVGGAGGQQLTGTPANQQPPSQPIHQTGALYLNQFGGEQASGRSNNKSYSSKGWPLSESLCDLNFDCDFELIKNCGLPVTTTTTAAARNEPQVGRKSRQTRPASSLQSAAGGSSLLVWAANQNSSIRGSGESKPGADKGCGGGGGKRETTGRKRQQQQQNNWRLATSISLEKPDRKANRSTCSANGKPATGEPCKRPLPIKLKWSASGWLMGSNKCAACRAATSLGKQQQQKPPKLISSSGTPADKAAGCGSDAPRAANKCSCTHLAGEGRRPPRATCSGGAAAASELLEELDKSLIACERQSFTCPHGVCLNPGFSPPAADIMRDTSVDLSRYYLSGGESNEDEDEEEEEEEEEDEEDEDEDAYASLNRAMIEATFDVSNVDHGGSEIDGCARSLSGASQPANTSANGSKLLVHEPGSLSDSFTFSASGSSPLIASSTTASTTSQVDARLQNPATGGHNLSVATKGPRRLALSNYRSSDLSEHKQSQPNQLPLAFSARRSTPAPNLDDNFILKRKTPNAGLKSSC